ncbi:MAG: hypothetical protein AAGC47_01255 [Bacteroidota bacterium]
MKKAAIFMIFLMSIGAVSAQDDQALRPLDETAFAGDYYDMTTVYYAQESTSQINKDGTLSGEIVSLHENGNVNESGQLNKGRKHGDWFKYNESGVLLNQVGYDLGLKDGPWKVWDQNGTLRLEFYYKNGKRVGTWKMFDESGALVKEESYD